MKTTTQDSTSTIQARAGSYRTQDGKAQIDWEITHRNGYPEFTASGSYQGSAGQCIDRIADAYPQDIQIQSLAGIWRGHHLCRIGPDDAAFLSAARFDNCGGESFYDKQARVFLADHGLTFRATLSNSKPPAWSDGKDGEHDHYRITISGKGRARLVFDFWQSIHGTQKGEVPSAYTVLSSLGSDANTPETLKDFCSEYDENPDSIRAKQAFTRCNRFAARLRAFFTASELEALSEIQ